MIHSIYIAKSISAPMISRTTVSIVENKGIIGDRYYQDLNRESVDYQITFIEQEVIDLYNYECGEKIEYHRPRRNIITTGIRLNTLVNRRFYCNGCIFNGIEICEPCKKLGDNISGFALKWFVGRGGLRCQILSGGTISVGDEIKVL